MSESIGKGVIEVSADATKLKAGIADAQRSLQGLGESATKASKSASDSIDRYVKRLETQAAVQGKSTREAELYRLSLRGANTQQIAAANSALKLTEAYERGISIGDTARRTFLAIGAAAVTGGIAAAVAFQKLVQGAAKFQDIAEKTGDTAVNIASLAVAAGTGGVQMETLAAASAKLTKGLTGVDDETKNAGAAITALGLDIAEFKSLKPADQFETVAKALAGFEDGTEKTAVAMALFGKSGAELLPFLKELGKEGGRQVILTEQQIKLADEYADKQAKTREQITLQAQAFATGLIPTIEKYKETLIAVLSDQSNLNAGMSVLKATMDGLVTVFKTIAVFAVSVGSAFNVIGTSIGATVAQAAALARLDFKGFSLIGKESSADIDLIFARAEKFSRSLFGSGAAPKFADPRLLGNPGSIAEQTKGFLPKLKFSGAADKEKTGGKDNSVAQEARAQLAFDIEAIKKAGEASTQTIANNLRLVEAQRAAALLEERAYYAERLSLLNRNTASQENALQQEIARLQTEKLGGKEKIDNDRKILDVQAKLAKVREDAATSVQVLAIQETAALKAVAQQYRDAEDAANDYLNTIRRTQARELSGVGIGNQERSRTSGRAQIEDAFSEQRRSLERGRRDAELGGSFGPDAQKKYDEELDRIKRFQSAALSEYESFFQSRIAAERNFANGANEAIANYVDEAGKSAGQIEQLFTNSFKGLEDGLTEFVAKGKLDFTSLADSIVADITRIIIKQQLIAPLASALGGGMSSGSGFGGGISDFLGSLLGRASGGPVSAGQMYRVNERGPELLNVAGNQYLMMGNQGGQVQPTALSGAGNTVNLVVNQSFAAGTSRATTLQAAADARRQLEFAGRNL